MKRNLLVCLIGWTFCTACGAVEPSAAEDEQVATTALAFTESGCAIAAENALFDDSNHHIVYTSPQTYTEPNCYKGQTIDTPPAWDGVNILGGAPATAIVSYADAPITDANTCLGASLDTYLYEMQADSTYASIEHRHATGIWNGSCTVPTYALNQLLAVDKTYRIAVSLRNCYNLTCPTLKFAINAQPR
jgi:hypothetical protein